MNTYFLIGNFGMIVRLAGPQRPPSLIFYFLPLYGYRIYRHNTVTFQKKIIFESKFSYIPKHIKDTTYLVNLNLKDKCSDFATHKSARCW